MLARALRRRGRKVGAAGDGASGLSAALAEDFDVVICDVRMPGMDGITFLEALKAERPTVEVIMVTGSPTSWTSTRAAELGAFAYLAKPYNLAAIESLVEAAAKRRAGTDGGPKL